MRRLSPLPVVALLLAACSTSTTTPAGQYQLSGAGAALAGRVVGAKASTTALTVVGSPSHVYLQVSGVYLSAAASCASPVTVQSYSSAQAKDLIVNPTLATGEPAAGTYQCLVVEVADSISFTSTSAGGACSAGATYAMDIYRDNGDTQAEQWRGVSGSSIAPLGTDTTIVSQRVALAFTSDTAAAYAAGWGHGQVIPLTGTITAPGSNTFVWDFTGAVTSNTFTTMGGASRSECGLEPPMPRVQ